MDNNVNPVAADLDAVADIAESVKRFAQREIAPHVGQWDDAG